MDFKRSIHVREGTCAKILKMLEIDKIKERFPGADRIMEDYARDFLKPPTKDKIPPNPPPAGEEPQKQLDLENQENSDTNNP